MKRFVWNFGFLAKGDEKQYIAVITSHYWNKTVVDEQKKHRKNSDELQYDFDKFRPSFSNLIFQSQLWLRQWKQDVSVCSLRDVRRVNKFFCMVL
eukprot:193427_1